MNPSLLTATVLTILALSSPARAASISNGPTAPVIGADDIANYGSVSGTDKWFYENSAAGAAKGQTFTTGNAAVLLKAITYQIAAGAGAAPTKTYAIRVGTVAGSTPTFSPIASETASQSVAWAAGDYVTWTFAAPVLLQSNTAYGIDVGMTGSTSGWLTGIPYLNVTGNEYPGGALYNSGTSGAGTTAMSLGTNDRLFHIDLEKPITPAFTLVATNPADGAANMLASSPLLATFSRYLTPGTGNITLRNLTDSVDTVIPVGDPRISLFENLLTINPGSALNWGKSYAVRIDPGTLVSDSAIPFAGISDDTTWNFGTAPGDPLLDAIAALKSHIIGAITLSAAQIEAHKLTIDADRNRFATSADAIAAAFDLVTTFDTVKGPLWVTQSLPARASVTNDNLNWVIFTVMQYLMDLTYNATNIANHQSLLNGFKFGSTANFPGSCAPPADPNLTYTATISASYLNTVGRATQGDGPGTFARKPTGCYLAPGSIATVTVPAALVGAGYLIRVGAHSWDHSNRPNIKRLDRATLVYSIDALETKVASPLGGGIYIEVPFLANAGVVSVQIKNAVRSPFFSAKSFHTTTPAQWLVERAHPAPWADFQSEKFMMQVPTSWISLMPDPTQLMADWDTAMDAVNDLMGFPRIRGKEAFYTQVDVQLRASVFAPGYPSCNVGGFSGTTNYGGNYNHYLVRGPQNGLDANIEFHEQGHGYFFPKFGGESESNVNLLYVPAMQALGMSPDQAFRQSCGSGSTYQTLDTTAIAWMCCFNFSPNEQPMAGLEKQYQLKGHAKFVDIARLFGWSGLNAYWASFTQDEENGTAPPADTDSMLLRLCQCVGKDIRPLFHFWGIYPNNPTTLGNAIAAAGIPSSLEIRDRLLYYKTLVPANNTAFRTFAMSWWGHKPLISGFWEETDHAMQWDEALDADAGPDAANVRPNGSIYVEASATDIQGRVQELVDLYFPNAIPPTLVTLSPADSATDVALSSNLTATFSESIAAGTGNITLKNLTDGTQSVIAVTDTTRVSFAGAILTINPTTDFLANKSYAIRIDAGAVKDLSNTSFAGIADDTTWNFTSTTPDLTPPSPDPLTWASVPHATSQSAIVMTAATATDISGVEYSFECTAGGGHSSGWQSGATYTDTGLSANTTYTYRVQARDKSPAHNTTGYSATASATTAQLGTFTSTTTAPVVDGADIANLGTQTGSDKWFFQTANESDPWDWAKGQTFTTGASGVLLKALTYKMDPTVKKAANTTYTIRVGTLSGTNFTTIAMAVCTQTVDTAVGAYMTWTFGTPVALSPNTTYGIDVAMVSAVAYTTGIPYLSYTANAYAGGQFYNSGPTGGSGSGPTIAVDTNTDRVFHLDIDTADTTPPTLAGNAIVDDKSGGPITVNTLVTYTVTFSEDMDASTVAAADFGNAGTAAVTIGAVTETTPGVFTVPVTPTSAGTLQLMVNAGAVLKDVAGNALATTSAIADNTTLTVDGTPPVLTSSAIADDKGGGPITVNTLVTYTVTFSEDMDATTVSAADFGNAGTAAVTIGTVSETTPGVFTVPVTPTTAGTLQLHVIAGAVLKDVAGNALVTASAIVDNTTLTVDGTPPVLTSSAIADDKSGGPITVNTLVTYTVTFSEDMDATTVTAADFGNAGDAAATIGTVSETTPGVFTVPVTPTSAGSLQLMVNAGAVLKDVAGNALVTASAILDDTTIAVIADYATWAGNAAFDTDSNNDGVDNGMAWLLGAVDPSADASGLLPKAANESGTLVLTFRCLKTAHRGAAVLKVQYSNDIGQADPWTSHEALVPDADGPVGNVVFDITADADPAFIKVRAEIPASAAPAGKLFGRLHAIGN
jgi:hypothetical protein